MVFVNVILIMKNLFSFFCPPCLLHFLPFFLFQHIAALLKYLLIPWDTQLIADLGVGLFYVEVCMHLCCNDLFSVSEQANGSAERIEHICIWFKQAFRTSWTCQGNDWSSFKTKGFPDWHFWGLGAFNHLLSISEGAEMRYYAAAINEWLPNDPLLNQHNTKLQCSYVWRRRVLCGSWDNQPKFFIIGITV